MGYIYGLVDPEEPDKIRYVGLTTKTLSWRLRRHLGGATSPDPSTPVLLWIRDLVNAGRKPLIVEIEGDLDTTDLELAERRWIYHFRSPWLLNVNRGCLPGTQAKIIAKQKGRVIPEDVRAKMRGPRGPRKEPMSSEEIERLRKRTRRSWETRYKKYGPSGSKDSPERRAERYTEVGRKLRAYRARPEVKARTSESSRQSNGAQMTEMNKNRPFFTCPYCSREVRGEGPLSNHIRKCPKRALADAR